MIAEFLTRVRERVEALTGREAREAVFGRPVHFAGAAPKTTTRAPRSRLQRAAELAGFEEVVSRWSRSPPAWRIGAQQPMREGDHALVFDFGGGTLDLAVLRVGGGGAQQVSATGGVDIAGDRFDQAIFRRAILPWLGRDVRWGPQRLDLPAHLLDALGDWQDVVALTATSRPWRSSARCKSDCTDPSGCWRWRISSSRATPLTCTTGSSNAKLRCRPTLCRRDFDAEAITIWQPVTRPRSRISSLVRPSHPRPMIEQTLERAGLAADQIDHVIRTGGSSAIPYFVDMLAGMFGPG